MSTRTDAMSKNTKIETGSAADPKAQGDPSGDSVLGEPPYSAGEYVLATKYSDGDPQDHWCVGYFKGMLSKVGGDRYEVVDAEGNLLRGNGFRRCKKITAERGAWMIQHAREIELSGKSVWHFARCRMSEH